MRIFDWNDVGDQTKWKNKAFTTKQQSYGFLPYYGFTSNNAPQNGVTQAAPPLPP